MSNPVSAGTEPEALKRIRESFLDIYHGPDELFHEYTLQQVAMRLNIPVDQYRKLYELRKTQEFPGYPSAASATKALGAWLTWFRSIPKGKKRPLFWAYVTKWGFKILQGSTLVALLGAGAHYLATIPQRERQAREQVKQAHYQAWQIINSATGQRTSAGRIEALQDLVGDHVTLLGLDAAGANLVGVDLHGANLVQSDLSRAILGGSNLQNTIMGGSNLEGSYFGVANLQHTLLPGANLQNASFLSANLRGAFLQSANLQGANFQNTNLDSSDLRYARGLEREALNQAHLCHTLLPDSLKDLSDRDCNTRWEQLPRRQ
jgi:BTB/POZ domain-containing protein KCTD9